MVIAVVVGVRFDAGAVLGEGEKVVLLRHVAVNRIRIKNTGFKARQVLEVVLDGQLWFMTLPTILVCIIGFRRYLIADLPCGLDLNLRRRDNNILRNPHQNLRLLLPDLPSSQHFLRSCLYRQHPHRWLRHPLHLASPGLARLLLYTRHLRRRTPLIRHAQPRRAAHRCLSRQRHHSLTDHHISVDCIQRCATESGCHEPCIG